MQQSGRGVVLKLNKASVYPEEVAVAEDRDICAVPDDPCGRAITRVFLFVFSACL